MTDNITTDVVAIGWGGEDWIDLAQYSDTWGALVNLVMNLRVPQNSGYLSSGTQLVAMGWGGVDWIDLAQYSDMWRALVNLVMNLRVPQNFGCLSSGLLVVLSSTVIGFAAGMR
jgi:hypothetical protein